MFEVLCMISCACILVASIVSMNEYEKFIVKWKKSVEEMNDAHLDKIEKLLDGEKK